MAEKILFVDDEPQILDGYRRQLGRKFRTDCALGGEEGLERIASDGPFAVVVSDMNMGAMNGIQFLTKVREVSPDTVRIMFTGGDNSTAVDAVNMGHVFRFLSKPCPTDVLEEALNAAVAQYQKISAEKALLQSTFSGAIKLVTYVLAATRPIAFGRTERLKALVKQFAKDVAPDALWRAELAALLSQLGCISLPEETLGKAYAGKQLPSREATHFREHPKVGAQLLKNVPRLEQVADIVLQQEKNFNGTGFPDDQVAGQDIPLEARLLKVAIDLDSLLLSGMQASQAIVEMKKRSGAYDENVLQSAERWAQQQRTIAV